LLKIVPVVCTDCDQVVEYLVIAGGMKLLF
jgi:hypothetical protein